MTNIVGEHKIVSSNLNSLDATLLHLKNLTNIKISKKLLKDDFNHSESYSKKYSKFLSYHILQALNFHYQSKNVDSSIRPVLQYYSYLNLSVAVIFAYKPANFESYKNHGAMDQTSQIDKINLSSKVIKISNKGSIPLFHSIISDSSIKGEKRLGEIINGCHMLQHELESFYNKKLISYCIIENVCEVSGKWHSCFNFRDHNSGSIPIRNKIEKAMPLLKEKYIFKKTSDDLLSYSSKDSWTRKDTALKNHRINGIKFINFGGHHYHNNHDTNYHWHGEYRKDLLPTLTSTLLTSFFLSSMVRYRPILLEKLLESQFSLAMNTFVEESDMIFIPALRNLLYREELVVTPT